jgi:hypothetical protein
VLHEKLKARSDKTLKSIRERQAQGTRYRGLFSDEAVAKVSEEMKTKNTTRAVMEEPPSASNPSTFAMTAGTKTGGPLELFVTIPLKSNNAKVSVSR